jgi:superfamily II DNA or RNA helicase
MAEKFSLAGLKADYLTSATNHNRDTVKQQLLQKKINYLFVVDIFNEGIDIPEIDTVLFLRPTESLTIFLQQLGRGLRLAENKDCLTVLDFVGNARPEYNFENKFRALIGKTATTVTKEIEDQFPHLPLGCSIILEKKAK